MKQTKTYSGFQHYLGFGSTEKNQYHILLKILFDDAALLSLKQRCGIPTFEEYVQRHRADIEDEEEDEEGENEREEEDMEWEKKIMTELATMYKSKVQYEKYVYVKRAFPWHAHTIRKLYTGGGITICIKPEFFSKNKGKHIYNTYWSSGRTEGGRIYTEGDFAEFLKKFDEESLEIVKDNEKKHGIPGDNDYRYASFVGEVMVPDRIPVEYFEKIVIRTSTRIARSDAFILKHLMKSKYGKLIEIINHIPDARYQNDFAIREKNDDHKPKTIFVVMILLMLTAVMVMIILLLLPTSLGSACGDCPWPRPIWRTPSTISTITIVPSDVFLCIS